MSPLSHPPLPCGTAAFVLLLPALVLPTAPRYPARGTISVPVVSAVSPDHAPNTGASVVLTGSSFTGAYQVVFGSHEVSFTVDSDSQITASLDSVSTAGWVDVSVTTPSGTATLEHAFDYFQPPTSIGKGCFTLAWSGSPTLGQGYTLTVTGLTPTQLLVRWPLAGPSKPSFSMRPFPNAIHCGILVQWTESLALSGSPRSHTFVIPDDSLLVGVRFQAQALVERAFWPDYSPPRLSLILDTVIGE